MAKAGDKTSTLRAAKKLLVDGGFGPQQAEQSIREELAAGRMPVKRLGGGDVPDREFWRSAKIDFEENSASAEVGQSLSGALIYGPDLDGFMVSHAHVLALLPEGAREHEEADSHTPSARWLMDEAKRMKAAGQVTPDMEKTKKAFAQELAKRMSKAAKTDSSIRSIKWTSIVNQLISWGLWPIAQIK
jgi:hypothetical protein